MTRTDRNKYVRTSPIVRLMWYFELDILRIPS